MSLDTITKQNIKEQTQQMAEAYYSNPCDQLKDNILEINQNLILYFINAFCRNVRALKEDELFSLGLIALDKAIKGYDPSKKTKFSTFAATCFKNEVGMELRKINRHSKVEYIEDLTPKNFHEEEGFELNIGKWINNNQLLIEDIIERREEKKLASFCMNEALKTLTEREKTFTEHMYSLNNKTKMSSNELSEKHGVSRSTVTITCRSAKNKILNYLLDTTNPKITSYIIQTIGGK